MSDHPARILFIDDEPRAGELFTRLMRATPHETEVFTDAAAALAAIESGGCDLVITDLSMPGMSGMDLLRAIRAQDSELPVIIVTGYSTVDNAIEAMRLGATDFVKKPYDFDELLIQIERSLEATRMRRELRVLRSQVRDTQQRFGMIGQSEAMQRIYATIAKVADIRCSVIIEGESGTGKELVARALHEASPWREQPFVVIDCGALTDTLLESELFGHEKGAFTGAVESRAGLLETASGGTVFLDEICNISDAMQTKLLRVVQEQQITRVGGVRPISIDVRFVVATNRNLEAMVEAGQFRHDLYHRLNVLKIELPPLRERREDIPLLLNAAIEECAERFGREVRGFDSASLERLMAHDWPGNVRELRNLVERHVALAEGPELHLMDELLSMPPAGAAPAGNAEPAIDHDLPDLHTLERRYIEKLLALNEGNREKTARMLGINKSTLWRKLQAWQTG
ncbi:MAG: sigma-54-dependent Fis family transcriptional regulator [Gammaproteobacteria bacterium]|nr:MAG: sigma-54-dependent Fis family transcriptional regulator [Gammaproteobacteria bacterium]